MISLAVLLFIGMAFLVVVFSRLMVLGARRGKGTISDEQLMISATTTVFGVMWIATWFYFLIVNWSSFIGQVKTLSFHVGLQIVTGALLILAGIGLYKKWAHRRMIYYTAMLVLFLSSFVSLFVYGPKGGDGISLMYGLGFLTFIVAGGFTLALYTIEQMGKAET